MNYRYKGLKASILIFQLASSASWCCRRLSLVAGAGTRGAAQLTGRRLLLFASSAFFATVNGNSDANGGSTGGGGGKSRRRTDAEWRRILPPDVYHVTRQAGTEPPHSGEYAEFFQNSGVYRCACCQAPLFASEAKFPSGCGWPAFSAALGAGGGISAPAAAVARRPDHSHGMSRVEILCAQCDAHLGHVFKDGLPPTGERYCVNSLAIDFDPSGLDGDTGK